MYMSGPIWVPCPTLPKARECFLSKSRLTEPPETMTEAAAPGGLEGVTMWVTEVAQSALDVVLTTAAGVHAGCVAEHAFALMLALTRRVGPPA